VCSDKICGNFQHNADYCRIFLVLEHKKGVAQNFNSATAPFCYYRVLRGNGLHNDLLRQLLILSVLEIK